MSKRLRESRGAGNGGQGDEEEKVLYCPSTSEGGASSTYAAPEIVTIVRQISPTVVLVRNYQGREMQVPRSSLQPISEDRLNAEREAKQAWMAEEYEVVEQLIRQYGVDPNPFLWKAKPAQLRMLLKLGANPNRKNHAGISLLCYEAEVGARVENVRILLEAGARDSTALPATVRTAIAALFLEEDEEPLFTNALATIALLRAVAPEDLEAARAQLEGDEWEQIKSTAKGQRILDALN
jgi:hypothetical protein